MFGPWDLIALDSLLVEHMHSGGPCFVREVAMAAIVTSDELALRISTVGDLRGAFDLEYDIKLSSNLRGMTVRGKVALPLHVARQRAFVNVGLQDLRENQRSQAGGSAAAKAAAWPATARRPVAGRVSSRGRRGGRLDADPSADGPPVLDHGALDEVQEHLEEMAEDDAAGIVEGYVVSEPPDLVEVDDDDVACATAATGALEVDEAGEAEGDAAASSSSGAAACGAGVPPGPPPPPPPVPPADEPLVGPTPLGYFYRGNRCMARITPVFNRSISMRCYQHTKCSVAMAEWKLPDLDSLRVWVLDVAPIPEGTSAAQKVALRDAHVQAMKQLAGSTVFPGRTRAALIAEANP
jgi:hypothetical protein